MRGSIGGVTWSVTAFHPQYDDFIYLADTGAVDAEDELPIFAYSQADADFTGLEAELFVPLLAEGANEVDMRLFTDYVRGELTTGDSLPRLPPLRYGARFEYHNERLLVGFEATRYDDQDDVAPFETETAGYMLVNADVRWRFGTEAGTAFELFVNEPGRDMSGPMHQRPCDAHGAGSQPQLLPVTGEEESKPNSCWHR